jgi:putative zinc finger/helix-turn-helix YgiT family protein
MECQKLKKEKTFKGVAIEYSTEAAVCSGCGLEAGSVHSAGEVQRAIADAYRRKMGLLTSQEITSLREARGMTQQQLAEAMNVDLDSIRYWETCLIQSKSVDFSLRKHLQGSSG